MLNSNNIKMNYGRWLYACFVLNGVSTLQDALEQGLIPKSVLDSGIELGCLRNMESIHISYLASSLRDRSYRPDEKIAHNIEALISACDAITEAFSQSLLHLEDAKAQGFVAKVKFYKPSGKLAYDGLSFSGNANPWDDFFINRLLDNQNAIVPNAVGEYNAVFTDTDVNHNDPNYRFSLSRARFI